MPLIFFRGKRLDAKYKINFKIQFLKYFLKQVMKTQYSNIMCSCTITAWELVQ